jgi:membrane fusion protein (multidrug efflux system)
MIIRVTILVIILLSIGTASAQAPVKVIAVKAEKRDIFDSVEALGTLKANESVELAPTVTKTVTAIGFEDGQRVEKGDILLEMTSSEEHALLREARATLNEAKTQFERLKPLQERGAAPLSVLDEKRREYETAKARLEVIESRLADLIIKAPFSGIVGLKNISIGALVSPGDMITTLDDDSVMKLDFSIPMTFLEDIKVGLEVTATSPAFPEITFSGKVASIDSRIDPVTRSFVVRALLDNPTSILRPGLLMSVILKRNPRSAIVIPEEALMPLGPMNYVFLSIEKDGSMVADRKEVKIGSRQPGIVEIIDGVNEGDTVVTHGTLKIRPGTALKVEG